MNCEFLIYLSIHLSEYGNLDKKKKEFVEVKLL